MNGEGIYEKKATFDAGVNLEEGDDEYGSSNFSQTSSPLKTTVSTNSATGGVGAGGNIEVYQADLSER